MIRIEFDDGGTRRSLEVLAKSFRELRPVMKTFTEYMRGEVDKIFSSGGDGQWPERTEEAQKAADSHKASKIAQIKREKYNSLRNSQRKDRGKAVANLAATPASDSKLTERRRRTVARHDALAAELERFASGGARSEEKRFKKLYERVGRREEKAATKIQAVEDGQALGQIAYSIGTKEESNSWSMYSGIPWAGAHNFGLTVGNGATLPARTFLEWTPARLEMFVQMANQYLIEKAEKAGGKKK